MAGSEAVRRDRWPWWSLLPFGLGSWAPIIAAVRCRVWWWGLLGIAGIAACVSGFALAQSSSAGGAHHTQAAVAGSLIYGSWFGGIVASFAIRPGYDARRGLPARGRPAWPRPSARSLEWSARYALTAFTIAFIAVILLGLVLRYLVGVHVEVGVGVLMVDAILLMGLVPLARKRGLSLSDLGVRPTIALRSLWLVVLAFVAYLVLAGLWTLAFISRSEQRAANILSGIHHLGTFDLVLTVIAVSLSAPIVEEIFFRGLLYRSLRNRLPVPQAALVAGLLFGLVHITGYPLITLPIKAAFGVIACLLYERTGSLLPGIALHSFVDASAVDFSLTGNDIIVLIVAGSLTTTLLLRAALLKTIRTPKTSVPLADASGGNSTQ
jgi:CAAX protease family protein